MTHTVITALVALIALANPAAAQTTFFGHDDPRGSFPNSKRAEQDFKHALADFGTESLDALPPSQIGPTLTFGGTGVTAVASDLIVTNNGTFATSSPNWLDDYLAQDEAFTLSRPVNGFGTFILDAGTISSESILTWKLENMAAGTSKTITVGTFVNGSPGNVAYFGVVDPEFVFDRITAFTTNGADITGYDDVTIGFVPEPNIAILLVGISTCFILRRVRP